MSPTDGISIDQVIDRALALAAGLPPSCAPYVEQVRRLRDRLAHGRLQVAVLGQFNRGKSTFINALLGIRALPVSVLPLTSVPTRILWGKQLAATIRFSDATPDARSEGDAVAVRELLIRHVTEEANPQNRLQVAEAVVECPSPVLSHGTVVIDTPGFGSTFIHNTKTTIDLLSQCDAALFVLSADILITQTEVDFLRQMRAHVPYVFFIYNKTDLLSPEELLDSTQFIRRTLMSSLDGATDVRLFPVCARAALAAQMQSTDDEQWRFSGMEAVRTEILDFLERQKFFALSHALVEKLRESIDRITATLQQRIDELNQPVLLLQRQAELGRTLAGPVEKRVAREQGFAGAEKKAFHAFVDKYMEDKITTLCTHVEAHLVQLGSHPPRGARPDGVIKAALPGFIREILGSAYTEAVAAANKPLQKAVWIHERELHGVVGQIRLVFIDKTASPAHDSPLLTDIEIQPDPWQITDPAPKLASLTLSLMERLGGRMRDPGFVRERFMPLFKEIIETNCTAMSVNLKSGLDRAVESLETQIQSCYDRMLDEMRTAQRTTEAALHAAEDAARPELERMRKMIGAFAEWKIQRGD